jgi:hypothetical protein
MIRRPNFSRYDQNRRDSVVSSLQGYSNPLDQGRAESMADEGGASGAHVDAAGPEVTVLVGRGARRAGRRLRRRPRQRWLVGAVLIGAAFAAGWLLRRRV